MITRDLWKRRIEESWQKAPIVWLTGVRRVGKTTLARSFSATYMNCDLPSVAERLQDPESFYSSLDSSLVILDEVHQLPDPSRVLKIAADAFPKIKVLATGSSTLAATKKFKDSLTGRKRVVHLVPVLMEELPNFGITDIRHRLFRGGLPEMLMSKEYDPEFYSEWMDSFYARDVQELFNVEKRSNFLKLLEILLRQSGGLLETSNLAKLTELTRPTVANYLEILQITNAVTLLRPYSGGGRREIVAQPKAYGFDSGFVSFARGWTNLRNDDCGPLWEHLVLETLLSLPQQITSIHFWRDKQQREVDFVLPEGRNTCHAIECKWQPDSFEPRGLLAFRSFYPKGDNYLICPSIKQPYTRKVKGLEITMANACHLRSLLSTQTKQRGNH